MLFLRTDHFIFENIGYKYCLCLNKLKEFLEIGLHKITISSMNIQAKYMSTAGKSTYNCFSAYQGCSTQYDPIMSLKVRDTFYARFRNHRKKQMYSGFQKHCRALYSNSVQRQLLKTDTIEGREIAQCAGIFPIYAGSQVYS